MLNFNEKLSIIESFPQLQRKNVSLGRVNFQFADSVSEKRTSSTIFTRMEMVLYMRENWLVIPQMPKGW